LVYFLSAAFSYLHFSYSINMVNGHIISNGPTTDATGSDSPMLQRIRAAKLLKEKVSAMLQDAVNINSQSKALRAQASYTRQQAADVKAEEDALRSKILDVNSHLKVSLPLSSSVPSLGFFFTQAVCRTARFFTRVFLPFFCAGGAFSNRRAVQQNERPGIRQPMGGQRRRRRHCAGPKNESESGFAQQRNTQGANPPSLPPPSPSLPPPSPTSTSRGQCHPPHPRLTPHSDLGHTL
jgi:hypothetical protein